MHCTVSKAFIVLFPPQIWRYNGTLVLRSLAIFLNLQLAVLFVNMGGTWVCCVFVSQQASLQGVPYLSYSRCHWCYVCRKHFNIPFLKLPPQNNSLIALKSYFDFDQNDINHLFFPTLFFSESLWVIKREKKGKSVFKR